MVEAPSGFKTVRVPIFCTHSSCKMQSTNPDDPRLTLASPVCTHEVVSTACS